MKVLMNVRSLKNNFDGDQLSFLIILKCKESIVSFEYFEVNMMLG